jgi:hypothetical protein
VHETDGDAIAYFMSRERVDRQCRECHSPGGSMEIPSLVKEVKEVKDVEDRGRRSQARVR